MRGRWGSSQAGFTLVEVLVAALVLVVGMLGVVAMVAGANARTLSTRGREGATNLQRELVERIRSIPYAQLTQPSIQGDLQALPGLEDADPASGYQITRRGFTYTITVGMCSVDDPKDRYGSHDASAYCSGTGGPASSPPDANPDDYKVTTVDLTWSGTQGGGHSRQQALINSSGTNVGPSICGITLNGGTSTVISDTGLTALNVGLCVSFQPSTLTLSVDGEAQGVASLGAGGWGYTWNLGAIVNAAYANGALLDGNYQLGARAYDADGRPGPARSLTVTLNRLPPLVPTGFVGGRNGSVVDFEWLANKERDIVGYRLYRNGTQVTSCSFVTTTTCQDTSPPVSALITYTLKALDRDSSGNLREGVGAPVAVTQVNPAPNAPTGLTRTTNSAGDTVLSWSAPPPALGVTVSFYRIYRDGTTAADRYDRTGLPTELTWTDARSAGESHAYRVTAVSTGLAESPFAGPVSS